MLFLHEVHRVRGAREDEFESRVPRRLAARAGEGRRRPPPLLHAPRARVGPRVHRRHGHGGARRRRLGAPRSRIQDGDLHDWVREVDQHRHVVSGKVAARRAVVTAAGVDLDAVPTERRATSSRCSWRTPRGRTRGCSTSTSRPRARTTRPSIAEERHGRGLLELQSVFQPAWGTGPHTRGRALAAGHRLRPAQEPAADRGAGGVPRAGHLDARRAPRPRRLGEPAAPHDGWSPLY